jgi:hypothetical protein
VVDAREHLGDLKGENEETNVSKEIARVSGRSPLCVARLSCVCTDRGGVGDHADGALDLGEVTARDDGRRLVVDTALREETERETGARASASTPDNGCCAIDARRQVHVSEVRLTLKPVGHLPRESEGERAKITWMHEQQITREAVDKPMEGGSACVRCVLSVCASDQSTNWMVRFVLMVCGSEKGTRSSRER